MQSTAPYQSDEAKTADVTRSFLSPFKTTIFSFNSRVSIEKEDKGTQFSKDMNDSTQDILDRAERAM